VSKGPNFQELILRLERFWADRGCVIWQPYSEKVGAGTMNPATLFRVLGPEPWNVAYVEPSFRPDDGRFAENPNRMQMHTQYQVILKPDPGNPQEVYLESLEALGLDRKQHDIRFVEDNWESPVLGAWGLGWEVWLDGLEITQFTYFQQAGGLPLDTVAVEITYGLERIAMYLQDVQEVWQLRWTDKVSYGDILKQQEIEYCEYEFNWATTKRMQQLYTLYMEEARATLDRDMVVPAYDYILKCSHTFNLLDVRGAVGVAERARFFAEMRALARMAAESFVKQRESLGFPLSSAQAATDPESGSGPVPTSPEEVAKGDMLLEIGTEELPPADVQRGLEQLTALVSERLAAHRLSHGEVKVTGTPRRLVAQVSDLVGRQPDEARWVRGPAAKSAYDAEGKPTRALEGFCRGQKVDPASVEQRTDEKGVAYVYALREESGRLAQEILAEVLPEMIGDLSFPKTMRWDSDGVAFSRPIRWLVALFGGDVIPFSYAGVQSGRTSRGLRPDRSPSVPIPAAGDYDVKMAEQGVLVDRDRRRSAVWGQVQALAEEVGGTVPPDDALLGEVTDLVEAPFALRGTFDEGHLTLPQEVLISVMKKHQRYFPVLSTDTGELMPYFVTVSNGEPSDARSVVHGNEGVIRARYADAAYFFRHDSEVPLEAYLAKLEGLTFQEELGSVREKVRRVEALLGALADDLELSGSDRLAALRAARLAKADLATSMVVEMTSLQGVMGRHYATASGEDPVVATAIEEHYRPRFPGDALPESRAGFALSVVDRLDSLTSLFAVGIKPRATADPYGLRRDALGLIANLTGHKVRFSLRKGIEAAAGGLPAAADPERLDAALDFILRRLDVQLKDEGYPHDVVEAALAGGCDDPYELRQITEGLAKMTSSAGWLDTLHAYSRCRRIVRDLPEQLPLDPARDPDAASAALHQATLEARERINGSTDRISTLSEVLPCLREPINRFFDEVLVMADDADIKRSRLALVQSVAALTDGIADLGCLEGF
jgi:glycyl-tRNA synthetase